MRARLHVARAAPASIGRAPISSATPAATRQLSTAAFAAVEALARSLERAAPGILSSISISENLARRSASGAPRADAGAARLSPETLADARATAARRAQRAGTMLSTRSGRAIRSFMIRLQT